MAETRTQGSVWQDSSRVAVGARTGRVVLGPRGGWAISDEPGAADGFIQLDASGAPQVDDAAIAGARIRLMNPNRIIAAS